MRRAKLQRRHPQELEETAVSEAPEDAAPEADAEVSEAPEDAAPEADAEVSEAPEDACTRGGRCKVILQLQGDLAVAEVTQVAEETEDIRGLTDNVENIILRNGSALEIDDWVLILYNEVKYPGKVLSVVDGGDRVEVKCLHKMNRTELGSFWRWPMQPDINFYDVHRECLQKISTPEPLGNERGLIFKVVELEN